MMWWRDRHWRALIVLIVAVCAGAEQQACAKDKRRVLFANEELYAETIAVGGAVCYELRGLADGTAYEARVSYPASTPAAFTVDVFRLESVGRTLLNTERTRFTCAANCQEQGWVALVTAAHEAILPPGATQPEPEIRYNFALDELYLMGTLPWRTVQLAFILVPVVLFALIVVRPRLLRALVAAQQHTGTGKQH